MKELNQYDGKIYYIRDRFALRFTNGSFHYAPTSVLQQAYINGFKVGQNVPVYEIIGGTMQHIGYTFKVFKYVTELFTSKIEENAKDHQLKLLKEIHSHGVNLICCHTCGSVLLHRITPVSEPEDTIVCNYCLTEVLPNDCCDYIY